MIDLWTPDILKIESALAGQMRLVGGCVRDFILDKKPDDIDIATPLSPKSVMAKLEMHHIRTRPIALYHGVIMAILEKNAYEITTLRQEIYNEAGQESVQFIQDYEQDSNRRDFTINALYMDKNNTIFDYHGGQVDLREKCIRFIGEPLNRLQQDPLRILRYLRFWADFGGTEPDKNILNCFPSVREGLKSISRGRKQKEMKKILKSKRVSEIHHLIEYYNLWPFITHHKTKPFSLLTSSEILESI